MLFAHFAYMWLTSKCNMLFSQPFPVSYPKIFTCPILQVSHL